MPSNHSRTSRQNRRASVTSKLDEVITSASETAPDHAAESRLGDDGIEHASALTDRAGVEAALEAHDRKWGPLEARAAAAARGEVTLTRGEMIMLARRADEKLQKRRSRPKGGSWKTVDRRVEMSRRLAQLQRQGLRWTDAIAAVSDEFRIPPKSVEAAVPILKSYAHSEHRVDDIDLEALKQGECPPIRSKRPRRKPETEADHLAALARMLRREGR